MNNAQFAQAIKERCKEKGIAISKMLSDCKIRKSLIYDLEKRNWTPSLEIAEQITDYLDCSVDFLLGRSDNTSTNKTIVEVDNLNDEQRLISAFRKLTDEGKIRVLDEVEMYANTQKFQKYTDIPKEA